MSLLSGVSGITSAGTWFTGWGCSCGMVGPPSSSSALSYGQSTRWSIRWALLLVRSNFPSVPRFCLSPWFFAAGGDKFPLCSFPRSPFSLPVCPSALLWYSVSTSPSLRAWLLFSSTVAGRLRGPASIPRDSLARTLAPFLGHDVYMLVCLYFSLVFFGIFCTH